MKKLSKTTIVNRIKQGKHVCPICGCKSINRVYHYVEYPEQHDEHFCSNCDVLLGFIDNSPYINVWDIIKECKHITYTRCVRIVKHFNDFF